MNIQPLMTDRVLNLIKEVNSLKPGHDIRIEIMRDEELLRRSAGAATKTGTDGVEVIYLDPQRADEHAVSHEFMHLFLHRSGWPQMYRMIGGDVFAERMADSVDNALDHYVFYPKLAEIGVDVSSYRETFVASFDKWSENEPHGSAVLWNALTIWESFLFGTEHKDRIITAIRKKHPQALSLARKLDNKCTTIINRTKSDIRKVMITVLDLLNKWIEDNSGFPHNLRQRIGISPLFRTEQLNQPATTLVNAVTERVYLNNKKIWILAFRLKSDWVRFRTYSCEDEIAPRGFATIKKKLESQTIRELIESEKLRYGVVDSVVNE